ncbi:triose-phosphate isomerase family protein [Microbacterium sp. NPDC058021]|uniref:triose-phosphate isomerase family protein n=1 Tax=Microbacterium sp. NPDC058021 TaxID=3346306 RepID=UPI0036DC1BAE
MARVTVGVSLKTYFGHGQAIEWCTRVADLVGICPAVADGSVELFVIPTFPQIVGAVDAFAGTPVVIGAQDVSQFEPDAYTGEVSAAELAEIGIGVVEIGHAERRRLFAETDDVVTAKVATALSHGVTPVLCLGEMHETSDAAAVVVDQLRSALASAPDGRVIVAYEPVWAIGAAEPAGPDHIIPVARALRAELDTLPDRAESSVVYGGSAGPGLLRRLDGSVDGLFLGRFAHDPANLLAVLHEAAALAPARTGPDA